VHRRRTCSRHTSNVSHRESFPPPAVTSDADDIDGRATDDVDAETAAAAHDDDDVGPFTPAAIGTVATVAVGGNGRATYAATLAMTTLYRRQPVTAVDVQTPTDCTTSSLSRVLVLWPGELLAPPLACCTDTDTVGRTPDVCAAKKSNSVSHDSDRPVCLSVCLSVRRSTDTQGAARSHCDEAQFC